MASGPSSVRKGEKKRRERRKAHVLLVFREPCCSTMEYLQTDMAVKGWELLKRQPTTGREKDLNHQITWMLCKENDPGKGTLTLADGGPWHLPGLWFVSSQLHARNTPLLSWAFCFLPNYFQFVPSNVDSLLIFTLGVFSFLCCFVPEAWFSHPHSAALLISLRPNWCFIWDFCLWSSSDRLQDEVRGT